MGTKTARLTVDFVTLQHGLYFGELKSVKKTAAADISLQISAAAFLYFFFIFRKTALFTPYFQIDADPHVKITGYDFTACFAFHQYFLECTSEADRKKMEKIHIQSEKSIF